MTQALEWREIEDDGEKNKEASKLMLIQHRVRAK